MNLLYPSANKYWHNRKRAAPLTAPDHGDEGMRGGGLRNPRDPFILSSIRAVTSIGSNTDLVPANTLTSSSTCPRSLDPAATIASRAGLLPQPSMPCHVAVPVALKAFRICPLSAV